MTEDLNNDGLQDMQDMVEVADPGMNIENVMSEFLASADVNAVFAEPVVHGEHMIIPAAEILSIAGFGLGSGYANAPGETPSGQGTSEGGGGGGGGRVLSRPVAVVVAYPGGVSVKPVIDVTKLWMAALTAIGFIFAASRKMRRGKFE